MNDAYAPTSIRGLTRADFEAAFGEQVSGYVAKEIAKTPLLYRSLSQRERDKWLLTILRVLFERKHESAGRHRLPAWEAGWSEHLDEIKEPFDPAVLTPKYFGKYPVVRWQGDLVMPVSPGFEYRCFEILQFWLFNKYFRGESPGIYEFGCGTGHNLVRARTVNPSAWLFGLDWSERSQEIIRRLDVVAFGGHGAAIPFNFFQPNLHWRPYHETNVVFTSAALEQTGERFKYFVDFLIKMKPKLCVHMEPINELLDENSLLDALSIRYARQRNYLDGFLAHLRKLEHDGVVRIRLARRTGIGSLFLEGYSVVVWSPC
jgi:hypothetical protein